MNNKKIFLSIFTGFIISWIVGFLYIILGMAAYVVYAFALIVIPRIEYREKIAVLVYLGIVLRHSLIYFYFLVIGGVSYETLIGYSIFIFSFIAGPETISSVESEVYKRYQIQLMNSELDFFSGVKPVSNGFIIYSIGPDLSDNTGFIIYDPTNGVFSAGDIILDSTENASNYK